MPTKKEMVAVLFTKEERAKIEAQTDEENRRAQRHEHVGHKLTRNKLIVRLALERLAQVAGTPQAVQGSESMTAPKKPPTRKPAIPTLSPKRGRPKGSGKGRTKVSLSFSLDPDVAEYAKGLGSAKVNDLLRRSMVRKTSR